MERKRSPADSMIPTIWWGVGGKKKANSRAGVRANARHARAWFALLPPQDVEPLTGLAMHGAKRLQANVRISAAEYRTSATSAGWNYHYNNLFGSLAPFNRTLYIPYYWVSKGASC
jgi:hypothetical protein